MAFLVPFYSPPLNYKPSLRDAEEMSDISSINQYCYPSAMFPTFPKVLIGQNYSKPDNLSRTLYFKVVKTEITEHSCDLHFIHSCMHSFFSLFTTSRKYVETLMFIYLNEHLILVPDRMPTLSWLSASTILPP